MALRYSQIVQGTRLRQKAELPLAGTYLDTETGAWVGDVATVDLVPLLPEEIAMVQAKATTYAKEKGTEAKEGEAAFDIAVALFTVHAAARVVGTDERFFDVPAETLFKAEGIGLDAFVYLYERQVLWQAESSPRPGFINPDDLQKEIERIGGGGDEATFFFARLRPAARLICMLTMARLLASYSKDRSGSGTASSSATASTSAPPSRKTTTNAKSVSARARGKKTRR